MKKIIISLAVLLGVSALPAMSAGDSLDVNSDGRVDSFDLVSARRDGASADELNAYLNPRGLYIQVTELSMAEAMREAVQCLTLFQETTG